MLNKKYYIMKQKIQLSIPQEAKNAALDISTDRKKRSLPGKNLGDVFVEALEKGLQLIQSESKK